MQPKQKKKESDLKMVAQALNRVRLWFGNISFHLTSRDFFFFAFLSIFFCNLPLDHNSQTFSE